MKVNTRFNKLIFATVVAVIINLLEFGLIYDQLQKILYAVFLTVLIFLVLLSNKFKFIALIFFFLLFILMAILFVFRQVEMANNVGSLGFIILIITLIAYLPEIISKGRIESFK